jgi:hypothetical protein
VKYSEAVKLSLLTSLAFAICEIVDGCIFKHTLVPTSSHFMSWLHDSYYAVCGIFMATWWSKR